MSWQCPICETVNQDVTPACTVCDHLAPVIESYISNEAIKLISEYNKKLDEVHLSEALEKYEEMLNAALEAMALYKENGLAVEKARDALDHMHKAEVQKTVKSLLKTAFENGNLVYANIMFKIMDDLSIDYSDLVGERNAINAQLAIENDVKNILDETNKLILQLNVTEAMRIIEEGLLKHPSDSALQARRDNIQALSSALNTMCNNRKQPSISHSDAASSVVSTPQKVRKFPKISKK